jgi:hypothetical protein
MEKLNEFEKALIKEGMKSVIQHFSEDIARAKAEGKNHLFGENYIPMVVSEIFNKLEIELADEKEYFMFNSQTQEQ